MRRLIRASLALVALVALAAGGLLLALDSDWGRARIAALVERATAGTDHTVKLSGVAGDPLDRLRVARIEIADRHGPWLTIENVEIAWSPRALIARRLALDAVVIGHAQLLRQPSAQDAASGSESTGLPFDIALSRFEIARLEIAPEIAGAALALGAAGSATLDRAGHAITLTAHHIARPADKIDLRWRDDAAGVNGALALTEAAGGWIARRLGLEAIPPLALRAELAGPRHDARLSLTAQADPARLSARGSIDLDAPSARLDIAAASGRMQPTPDLAWESLALDAAISGPLRAPLLRAQLDLRGLVAGAAAADSLRIVSDGTQDGRTTRLKLRASAGGLRIPGSLADLVAAAPLEAEGELEIDGTGVRIDDARLRHPLIAVSARGRVGAGRIEGSLDADVASIRGPLAAYGIDAAGALHATIGIAGPMTTPDVTLEARLAALQADPRIAALLGAAPTLAARLRVTPARIDIARAALNGASLQVEAVGTISPRDLTADFTATLGDAGALVAGLGGAITASGRVSGPHNALALRAQLASDALTRDAQRLEALRIEVQAEALPHAPRAAVTLSARIGENRVQGDLRGALAADGGWTVTLGTFDFPGLTASGAARGRDATIAAARLQAEARSLTPLGTLLGVPLAGAGTLTIASTGDPLAAAARFDVDLQLRDARFQGTGARRLALIAVLRGDPIAPEIASSTLEIDDLLIGEDTVAVRAQAQGKLDALRLSAGDLRVRGQSFSLRGPARLAWDDGLRVEQLRLVIGAGTLAAQGRIAASDTDMRVTATQVPLALLAAIDPALAADGALDGELRLTGPLDALGGTFRLRASGVRLRDGTGRGLPPGRMRLDADIARGVARVSGEASLGQSRLRANGTVPLSTDGALGIDVQGNVDLALTDPLLTPAGRRARGQLRVELGLRGSPAAPVASGTLALADGLFEDSLNGLRFDRLAGEARLQDGAIAALSLRGRAGAGDVALTGSLGLDPRGAPADLRLVMRNARLSQSRQATIVADGDVTLRGRLPDALLAAGRINVTRAEFQLAESPTVDLPVLEVREVGNGPRRVPRQKPPADNPFLALPGVGLDLVVDMPGSVFVRGSGVEVQAGGSLRVTGNAADPVVAGDIALRRGSYTVVGQRLEFSRGTIGFDGGAYSDPSLDFEARRASGGITAILRLGGRPSAPTVTLASEPEMPTDEVLARLLLGRPLAELSPLEFAQIAQGAASLFIGDPGGGRIDALRRRLGLDQLRIAPTRGGTGAGLEAGRTVAPGVYVGVRPGNEPTTPNATVQIEITPRLRLETDIGTTGRAGITYEFDY
jgi:translocation and assembly module TamB